MDTPSDIIDLSALYMRIFFCGCFFMFIYNFGASILRSKGDTQRPLIFLAISGVLNVCLNIFFVVIFKMSVAGVALATVISNALSAFLVCNTLMHETDATHLDLKKLGIVPSVAWEIIRIGVPTGIQGMVFSLSNVVIQSSINSFGSSTIVAGNSAGANIESFVYIGMVFSQATVTFTSQNIGAGNKKQVKKILLYTLALSTIFGTLLGVLVNIFGDTCLGFYTNDQSVIDVGIVRLRYVALFLALNGILDCFVASMRGMGFSSTPTIFMLLGICGVRLCWIWTMFPIFNNLPSIYVCYPISWTVTSIVQMVMWQICYKKVMKAQ
jgi:putative MATE family efflux protein